MSDSEGRTGSKEDKKAVIHRCSIQHRTIVISALREQSSPYEGPEGPSVTC